MLIWVLESISDRGSVYFQNIFIVELFNGEKINFCFYIRVRGSAKRVRVNIDQLQVWYHLYSYWNKKFKWLQKHYEFIIIFEIIQIKDLEWLKLEVKIASEVQIDFK